MSDAASPFAASFDAPELSDVLLCVYTDIASVEPIVNKARNLLLKCFRGNASAAQEAGSTKSASGTPARRYHCHALVLSVLSEFFKAQLSSNWRELEGSSSTSRAPASSKRSVDIHVEAEELDALHELLQLLYRQTLPTVPPTAPHFLQCLKLADRFGAVSSMELLLGGLAALPSADIDYALLSYVFQAPPGVCVSRSYTSLLDSCSKALVRLFGDVPAVIKDKALMRQFRSLPHAAVLAWIKEDELQVHSENCVVFLVSAWVQANQDSTAAQHEELAHQTRVFDLGPAYLHHILPTLSWFKGCSNMEYMPAVLSYVRAGIKMGAGLEADKGKVKKLFEFPPGWIAKPRKRSSGGHTGSWVLSSSQLKELDADTVLNALVPASPLYVNGFLLRMQVERASNVPSAATPAAPGKTLGIFLGVDGAAMELRGVPVPGRTLVHIGAKTIKLGSSGSEHRSQGILLAACMYEAANAWGSGNALTAAAPTVLELVSPYVHEGQLHIEATVAAVDP